MIKAFLFCKVLFFTTSIVLEAIPAIRYMFFVAPLLSGANKKGCRFYRV